MKLNASNFLSFHPDANAGKMAIETAQEAFDTANDALKLYDTVLDQNVKETLKKFENPSPAQDYSHESSDILGSITTHLLNAMDGHNSVSQSIYEWCGLSASLLATYVKLFDGGNASKQNAQKTILIKVLENGMKQMGKALGKLGICASEFRGTSAMLATLLVQLGKDYDENSEYFRQKIKQILRESSSAAAQISGPSGATGIASTVIEERLIAELKERFKSIREYHENSKKIVDQAIVDIEQSKEKLNEKIQKIGEQKEKIDKTGSYTPTDEQRKSLVQTVENFISNCNEYRRKHA